MGRTNMRFEAPRRDQTSIEISGLRNLNARFNP